MHAVLGAPEQVDFKAVICAEEEKLPLLVAVEVVFEDVTDDEILEETPSERIPRNLFFGFESEKAGGKACLGEVELWGLREPLADVRVVGLKTEDNKRRFEDIEPFGQCRVAHAHFARECVEVDKLSDTACEQDEKSIESRGILDVGDLPDIAFKVGLQIVLVVNVGVERGYRELWHSAAKNECVLREPDLGDAFELGEVQGEKLEECASSGEGLRDGLLEKRLM